MKNFEDTNVGAISQNVPADHASTKLLSEAHSELSNKAQSENCSSALSALEKNTSNQELLKNVRLACAANSDTLPKEMAPSQALLSVDDEAHIRAHDRLSQVNNELSRKGWFGISSPDFQGLYDTLRDMPNADRLELQKDFTAAKNGTLVQAIADKFGKNPLEYKELVGLLTRDDKPESMIALNLHMGLLHIDELKRAEDKQNAAFVAGVQNNVLNHGRLEPGSAGLLNGVNAMVSHKGILKESENLIQVLSKVDPKQVAEIQKSHLSSYHRDLREMAEETPGVTNELLAAFQKAGF